MQLSVPDVVGAWPSNTPADSEALVKAVQLLAVARWPVADRDSKHPLTAAAAGGQPWAVWCTLLQQLPRHTWDLPCEAAAAAVTPGCAATLEGVVGLGGLAAFIDEHGSGWYAAAAKNGDPGTMECLRRLGMPLGEGVLGAAVKQGAPLCALEWLVEQGAPWGVWEVRFAVGMLEVHYPRPRDRERQEVGAWLKGLLAAAG